jgi:hypothetical protein
MRKIFTIVVLFFTIAATSFAGDKTSKIIVNEMYGCKNKQVFLRHITAKMSQDDPSANARAVQAARMAGTCVFFKKGQKVKIIDQDKEKDLVQVQTTNGVIMWTESGVFTNYDDREYLETQKLLGIGGK